MIVLCVNCGWLGTEKDLRAMPIKSEKFKSIIEANNMHMKTCPTCKEAEICWKEEYCDNLYSDVTNAETVQNIPELMQRVEEVVEKYEPEDDEYADEAVDNIFSKIEVPTIPKAHVNPDGTIRLPKGKLKEQQCDICLEKFDSFIKTSRCDVCYDKLMVKMQGDVNKEQKKSKKKIAKKRSKDHKKTMKKIRKKIKKVS